MAFWNKKIPPGDIAAAESARVSLPGAPADVDGKSNLDSKLSSQCFTALNVTATPTPPSKINGEKEHQRSVSGVPACAGGVAGAAG